MLGRRAEGISHKRNFMMARAFDGMASDGIELEFDHRIPVSEGGTDALDNLQTLCSHCNRGKARPSNTRTISSFLSPR
jgi:5-methylcytosine-specific restriction endonuclease McrA